MVAKYSQQVLSITFDDGLRHGAEVACEILAQHGLNATFYIVTGWVEPIRAAVKEPYNVGRSHGDWSFWRRVRDAGHEVGSHTFSHINAGGKKAMLVPWLVGREIERSYADLAREVPQVRYTIAMPWNTGTGRSEMLVRRRFSGCRVGGPLFYNRMDASDRFRLASWAPSPATREAEFAEAIFGIPENGWLILQFHSFDDEGWEPISRTQFSRLCEIASATPGLTVRTVADAIGGPASASGQAGML
jgi:peptidoglycan/xylan/chitin deacetylase (PgdA/CDA1 family)